MAGFLSGRKGNVKVKVTELKGWKIPEPASEDMEAAFLEMGLEWIQDIPYKELTDRPLTLDVLRPKGIAAGEKRPAVLCIHGGAWRKGTNKNYNAAALALNGYITFNLKYRLTTEAPFPANLEDCMDALHWIQGHGNEYGAGGNQIGVRGGSSGAHLALMMALTAEPGEVKAVAAACAPSNLPALYQSTLSANAFFAKKSADILVERREEAASLLGGSSGAKEADLEGLKAILNAKGFASAFDMLMGQELGENADVLAAASPYQLLDQATEERIKGLPKLLLLHGLADPLVPVYQTLMLYQKLREKGADCQMELFEEAEHDYMFHHGVFQPQRMVKLLEFFDSAFQGRQYNI